MFPDREHETEAHVNTEEESDDAGDAHSFEVRGDGGQHDYAGADEHSGGEDGVGKAVGDGVEGDSERFEAFGVDFVFERDAEFSSADALVKLAEVSGEIAEEVEGLDGDTFKNTADSPGTEFTKENARGVGFAEFDKVELGIEGATDGLDLGERFDAEIEGGLHTKMIIAKEVEEAVENGSEADLAEWAAQVLLGELFDFGLKKHLIVRDSLFGKIENGAGGLVVIAFAETADEEGDALAHLGREFAHHAIVEKHDAAIGKDRHVAGVGVAVEKTVLEDLLVDEAGHGDGEFLGIDALSDEAFGVGDGYAVEEVHREHTGRRAVAVDFRDANGRVALELIREAFGVGGFVFEVEFALEGFGEFLHEAGGVEPGGFGHVFFDKAGEIVKNGDVQGDGLLDVGPLDFDSDNGAVGKFGAVDLGNAGTADGFVFEVPEEGADRMAELLFDNFFGLGSGERRNAALEFREFDEVFVGDDVASAAEDLAEFNKGGTEFFQCEAETDGEGFGEDVAVGMEANRRVLNLQKMLERDKAEDIGKSVFEKDANDFAIAGNVVIEVNR